MKKLTVFTPTYNRKHLLLRLYESLRSQTIKDFLWLIIDDGSTDDTGLLVEQWQQENILEIAYIFKENEGMHSAHNVAYNRITTDWNTCIDSDDKMPLNAVELILRATETVNDDNCYALVGLDADFEGNILGKKIPETLKQVRMMELESLHGINGDKKLVYKTKIMRDLPPYPIFKGERLVPLSYKSLEAEKKYYLKPVNELWCLVEYQPDGSTKNMLKQYRRHPRGFAFMRKAKLDSTLPFKEKVKSAVHLVSSVLFSGDFKSLVQTRKTLLILAVFPFGLALNLYIRLKTQKNP